MPIPLVATGVTRNFSATYLCRCWIGNTSGKSHGQNSHMPNSIDEQILRFDVAMNNSLSMSVSKRSHRWAKVVSRSSCIQLSVLTNEFRMIDPSEDLVRQI